MASLLDVLHRIVDLLPHASETGRSDLHADVDALRADVEQLSADVDSGQAPAPESGAQTGVQGPA